MAVKVIKPRMKLPREDEVLKSLPLHHFINCFANLPNESDPDGDSIFREYCPRGDLFDLQNDMCHRNAGIFSEAFIWAVYSQRGSVVTFLRARKNRLRHLTDADFWRCGVHRDIKLENVLIASRGRKAGSQAW